MLTLEAVKKATAREISETHKRGDELAFSYNTLSARLAQRLDCRKEDLKAYKADLKIHAAECLEAIVNADNANADNQDESDADEVVAVTSKANAKPPQELSDSESSTSAAKEAKQDSVKAVSKGKRKKSGEGVVYKSKEFVDSQDNPFSGNIDEDAVPPKKKRKSNTKAKDEEKEAATTVKPKKSAKPIDLSSDREEKPAKSKNKGSKKAADSDQSPDELEIERLKKFIKACGVRFMNKEIADISTKEAIRYLKQKLSDLGMTGRLSMEKAKKIKDERELAKERADLLGSTEINADEKRASRSKPAAQSIPRKKKFLLAGDPESSEDERQVEESDGTVEEDSEFEKEQEKLDRRAQKNAKVSQMNTCDFDA